MIHGGRDYFKYDLLVTNYSVSSYPNIYGEDGLKNVLDRNVLVLCAWKWLPLVNIAPFLAICLVYFLPYTDGAYVLCS